MNTLATAVMYAGALLLAGLFVIVFEQLLTGRIGLHGLLSAKDAPTTSTTIRGQLLVTTIVGALVYVTQAARHPNAFPKLPWPVLGGLAASHATYLFEKWRRRSL